MENENEQKWYFEKQGQQIGPVTVNTIKARVEANDLTYGDVVWQKGAPAWIKLEESELKYLLEDRPPPPTKGKITNAPIWVLLIFPMLMFLLSQTTLRQQPEQTRLIIVAVAWSVIFALPIIDSFMLRSKGYNTGSFHWWFWFTPVYLYRRAASLDQGMVFFGIYMFIYIFIPGIYLVGSAR